MYYNIADRIIRERLEHNYDITAEAAVEVQKILNEKAGIGIKAIKPERTKIGFEELLILYQEENTRMSRTY